MTAAELVTLLVEREAPRVDARVAVLLNRSLLRIYSQPSLTSFLRDAGIVVDDDGVHRLQFLFNRLPEEVIPAVERLLCASDFKKHAWKQFILNGQAIIGLEIYADPDDLPDGTIDYAF